jgi:hypothetical protein
MNASATVGPLPGNFAPTLEAVPSGNPETRRAPRDSR